MVKTKPLLTKSTALVLTAAMAVSSLVPVVLFGRADAGIPTNRKITLETSQAAATNVTYSVSFVTAQEGAASNIGSMVIDFCDETPIIGDTCTAPTDFDINEANLVLANQVGITDWQIDADTTTNTLVLTRTGGAASVNNGVTVSLDLGDGTDGVTNPSLGNYTFYARILTFATVDGGQDYASDTPGTYVDAGGIALSTANQLKITTKVQERLTFCLYADATCDAEVETTGAARTTEIYLGDTNHVLDPAHNYVNNSARFNIATNATGDAVVYMKGATLTNSASDTITAMGSAVDNDSTEGSEEFGMCAWQSSGSGLTIQAPYNDTTNNCDSTTEGMDGDASAYFAFDDTATASASGDHLATKVAGTTSTARLAFLGNIAWETEAGIYTTTLTFIATGTY